LDYKIFMGFKLLMVNVIIDYCSKFHYFIINYNFIEIVKAVKAINTIIN